MSERLKLFFDMEFTGLRQDTTPISIGIVSETGHTFYAEFTDYDKSHINDWLQKNVLDKLTLLGRVGTSGVHTNGVHTTVCGNTDTVRDAFGYWLRDDLAGEDVEMWSDVLAYDWVLFNKIFATYENGYPNLPKQVYYIPFDIATLMKMSGIDPDVTREDVVDLHTPTFGDAEERGVQKHNSLYDAYIIEAWYNHIRSDRKNAN